MATRKVSRASWAAAGIASVVAAANTTAKADVVRMVVPLLVGHQNRG